MLYSFIGIARVGKSALSARHQHAFALAHQVNRLARPHPPAEPFLATRGKAPDGLADAFEQYLDLGFVFLQEGHLYGKIEGPGRRGR